MDRHANSSFTGLNAGLLFIREEYRALEEEIEHQAIKNIVVTGNPGIGKSMFALYMLIRHVIWPLFLRTRHRSALLWCQPPLSSYTLLPCFIGLLFCRKIKTNTVLWQAGVDDPYFWLFHDGVVRVIDKDHVRQVSSTATLSRASHAMHSNVGWHLCCYCPKHFQVLDSVNHVECQNIAEAAIRNLAWTARRGTLGELPQGKNVSVALSLPDG